MEKIFYIVPTLQRTGPINQLHNLVKYLDRGHYSVEIITLSPEKADSRLADFRELGIPVTSLNLINIADMINSRRVIESFIEKNGVQIAHSQGIRPDLLIRLIRNKIPRVCTVRNYPQLDYMMTYGNLKGLIMCRLHVWAMQTFNICVGVSEGVRNNLHSKFGLTNIFTIRNGVDSSIYYPLENDEKIKLRRELKLPIDKRIWVSVGHLSARKDPLFIIRAWKKYFNDKNNHLVFLGDGSLYEQCLAESVQTDNISLLGRVGNVSKYLQASDYFLSAAKAEGLPNTVLEALACGLPVCLSDIVPHREIVELNINSGCMFEIGSEKSFIDNINMLMITDRINSAAALSSFKKNFDARIMAQEYEKLYDRLLIH